MGLWAWAGEVAGTNVLRVPWFEDLRVPFGPAHTLSQMRRFHHWIDFSGSAWPESSMDLVVLSSRWKILDVWSHHGTGEAFLHCQGPVAYQLHWKKAYHFLLQMSWPDFRSKGPPALQLLDSDMLHSLQNLLFHHRHLQQQWNRPCDKWEDSFHHSQGLLLHPSHRSVYGLNVDVFPEPQNWSPSHPSDVIWMGALGGN